LDGESSLLSTTNLEGREEGESRERRKPFKLARRVFLLFPKEVTRTLWRGREINGEEGREERKADFLS
jgi:hypothetical protein